MAKTAREHNLITENSLLSEIRVVNLRSASVKHLSHTTLSLLLLYMGC